MGVRDRAWLSDGAFAYLRRKRSLEALAESTLPRHLALAVAVRDFGHSVRELEPVINAGDARWLAEFKGRLHDPLPPAVAADVPDWLWERLGDVYGDDARAALTRSWQTPAPLDLRANIMKTTRDAALAALVRRRTCRLRRRPMRRTACASTAGHRSRAIRGSSMAASKCRTRAAS